MENKLKFHFIIREGDVLDESMSLNAHESLINKKSKISF